MIPSPHLSTGFSRRGWIAAYRRVAATLACILAGLALLIVGAAVTAPSVLAQDKGPATTGADRREVVAGVPRFWPPQYSVDENGRPTGFAIDVMNEIAARAGVRVTYRVKDNFAEVVEAMEDGSVDLIPNSGITPARQTGYSFTAPVETFVISIFVRDDTVDIGNIADLAGHRIAVVEFNVGLTLLKDRQDIDLAVHRDARSALFSLLSGQVDAFVYPRPVLLNLARRIGVEDRIKAVGAPLTEIKRGIRLKKGDAALLASLNKAVKGFVGTPAYQAIYVKWYGSPTPFWAAARIAWTMGGLIVAVLIVMAWWRYHSVVRLNRNLRQTITDREQAEAALRESEKRFEQLFEHVPDAIYVRCDDEIVCANEAAVRMFAAGSKERFMERRSIELVHPDDRHKIHTRRRLLENTTQSYSPMEVRYLRFDNSNFLGEGKGSHILWNGEPAILVVTRDITGRRRGELADRRLAAIVESSVDAIVAVTVDGTVTDWNPAAERMYGYTADEVIGRSISIIAPPGVEPVIAENMSALRIGQNIEPFEAVRQRKDGSLVDVSLSFSPIKDDAGNLLGVSAIHSNIADRKRNEEALRDSEAQMRLVTDAIPAQIAYIDREHRIRFANRPYADAQNVSQDEIIGKHLRDFRGDDLYVSFLPYIRRTLAGETTSNEGETWLDDGRRLYFRATRVPHFGDGGEVLGYFVIIVDLTEHQEREMQLRQAQKMEAVGQLTGGIAHEFNNLLMVIVGNLEMALDRVADDDTGNLLSSAMRGAMRGAGLTRQLLAFSRKQELHVEHVALNRLVLGMHDMMRRTLGETITIETELQADAWPVLADVGQTESALLNLALNARDAMPRGGRITIVTANRTIDDRHGAAHPGVDAGDYVMLEMSDTGSGMAPEVLERVFDPFFTTKEVGKGTGLGLSMVYGFAEQSGGFIDIESDVGQGTRVRIFLPRATGGEATVAPKAGEPVPEFNFGKTILVVEDDANVRDLVVHLLSQFGCTTVEAEDGETALACLEERSDIDLLFTDVVLPRGMSGPGIAREALRRFPRLRVVFTSGYPDREVSELAWDGEEARFIRKPYRKSDLGKTLAAVLDSDRGR